MVAPSRTVATFTTVPVPAITGLLCRDGVAERSLAQDVALPGALLCDATVSLLVWKVPEDMKP
jgi:hypothetical protein